MSDQATESMSERELAEFFAEEVFSDKPRSVGEALAAADAAAEVTPAEIEEGAPQPPPAEPPVVVTDEPVQDTPAPVTEDDLGEAPAEEAFPEEPEGDTSDDPNVVWATKKYGDDPAKWAKAAYDQEQHISRLAGEKKEAEELAQGWYEEAQRIQSEAAQTQQMGMPLSTQEENWIEQSLQNPYQYARQAALQGNFNLYSGVLARVAEENPMMAAQIGAQVQREMEQAAEAENGYQQPSLADALNYSIQRLGIDLSVYGEPMSMKIAELGEHHPYVQTILEGEQGARDMALMAVYDLVRATAMSTRKVRSVEREEQIKHEADLRRQAAGVVTGGPTPTEVPKQSAFMDAMEQEWRQRGQWGEE